MSHGAPDTRRWLGPFRMAQSGKDGTLITRFPSIAFFIILAVLVVIFQWQLSWPSCVLLLKLSVAQRACSFQRLRL